MPAPELAASLAAAQGGVLTLNQARGCGMREAEVRTLLRSGAWSSPRRGVLAPIGMDLLDERERHVLQAAAAVLTTQAEVVVSHESAAAVHELPLLGRLPDTPRLSRVRGEEAAPDRPRHRLGAVLCSRVPDGHHTRIGGVPVTTLARTTVDLARTCSAIGGVMAVDKALRLRVSRSELEGVLDDCTGWPGVALARDVVAFGDGLSESPLESAARWALAQAGLPAPELQAWIGQDEPEARVDFLFRKQCVVLEADGMLKYETREDLVSEKRRQLMLERLGYVVVRFSWFEAVVRPDLLIAKVERALASAAA